MFHRVPPPQFQGEGGGVWGLSLSSCYLPLWGWGKWSSPFLPGTPSNLEAGWEVLCVRGPHSRRGLKVWGRASDTQAGSRGPWPPTLHTHTHTHTHTPGSLCPQHSLVFNKGAWASSRIWGGPVRVKISAFTMLLLFSRSVKTPWTAARQASLSFTVSWACYSWPGVGSGICIF